MKGNCFGLIVIAVMMLGFAACPTEGGGPPPPAGADYTIRTGSSAGTFTAKYKDGATVGTADDSIANVIDAIKSHALGAACSIQFGKGGSNVLDIGTNMVTFNNSGTPGWGVITLLGKITSQNQYNTIILNNNVSINCNAVIENTVSCAINNNGSGKITILGGTVTSVNPSDGTITLSSSGSNEVLVVSGGTVSNTSTGAAIYNTSTGTVTISGGTVSAKTGRAVHNQTTGKISVSGENALVTSEVTGNFGTINLSGSGIFEMSKGTVRNTSTGSAIRNSSTSGTINISGGTVSNTSSGNAIYNTNNGAITISGGTVSAVTGVAINNNSSGKITISGDAIVTSAYVGTVGTIYLYAGTVGTDVLEIRGNSTVSNTSVATQSMAIYNNGPGKIIISESATVTSKFSSSSLGGTIYLNNTASGGERLVINGGTISNTYDAANGRSIFNNTSGTITVNNGIVSAAAGRAITNYSTGTVNISGGTFSAATGNAVYNATTGKITVSQDVGKTTIITSGNTTADQGTIFINDSGSTILPRLEISGGTISNTSIGANGNAVYNGSTGAVNITGGTISTTATSGYAVYNNNTGVVTITSPAVLVPTGSKYGGYITGP